MSFVDHITITIKAGDGGPGASSFRREKFVPMGGPDGGDGGRGGDVVFVATPKLQTLLDLTLRRVYKAKNGIHGGKKKMFGPDGEDCVIEVPLGTMIFDDENNLIVDLVNNGQTYIAAKGGKGGKGNVHFSTATTRAPRYAQKGLPGEEFKIRLEVRLIAKIGLVGLPNAGKSTLLKALTRANPKIGDYPFTTLFPNVGVLKFHDREWVFADIPGLIEGASEGHGLGAAFLRHIDRTECIVHLVGMDFEDPEQTWKDYLTVQNELQKSPLNLHLKPCIVALNKSDLIDCDTIELHKKIFEKNNVHPVVISGLAHQGLQDLISGIGTLIEEHPEG